MKSNVTYMNVKKKVQRYETSENNLVWNFVLFLKKSVVYAAFGLDKKLLKQHRNTFCSMKMFAYNQRTRQSQLLLRDFVRSCYSRSLTCVYQGFQPAGRLDVLRRLRPLLRITYIHNKLNNNLGGQVYLELQLLHLRLARVVVLRPSKKAVHLM